MSLFYPEGTLSPTGFVIIFFLFYCLVQLGRGIASGLIGRREIYQLKIQWISLFFGLFIFYLILNWTDIAANAWRGYEIGAQRDREEFLKLFRELQK